MNKIIVIGGGASGLMAACTAAAAGVRVLLLEKNEKLGKKIYITGKGRCNVTNLCDAETFRKNVVKNPRFLFSALNALPPERMVNWLESRGCPTVCERGNRVFPLSQKASDVTRAFEGELHRLGAEIRLHTRVSSLWLKDGLLKGVITEEGETISGDAVILCTGGCSYPSTGSTGDGWTLLKTCGHTLYPPLPSLVGLESPDAWVRDLQGLTLKNVRLNLCRGKRLLYSELGEMLFTHFGISGPLVLSASAYAAELDPAEYSITIDLKPALSEEQLDTRILRDIASAPRKQLMSLLCGLLPGRLASVLADLCHLDGEKPVSSLTREERAALVRLLRALPVSISGSRSLEEAVVTRGGGDVKEWNASTMESKRIPGLYIAGELLDVDALTGGFNLHIAFSTGYLAGMSAAKQKNLR